MRVWEGLKKKQSLRKQSGKEHIGTKKNQNELNFSCREWEGIQYYMKTEKQTSANGKFHFKIGSFVMLKNTHFINILQVPQYVNAWLNILREQYVFRWFVLSCEHG